MPLLKKRKFEKASTVEFLRDDEEVFYCTITNEIFRDYEEFCERMFLCNSMVWTCSMTGKTNLTYSEALESEENATRSLKEFPNELKVPILLLATQTMRTAFGDMAEDVFVYARDRYFIGEFIEVSFDANKWKEARILQVNAPSGNEMKKSTENGDSGDKAPHPPPTLYKYEVEHRDPDDKDISEIMIVDSTQIRRRKSHYNREKSKLFLKQHVEQTSSGVFVIKKSAYDAFNLAKVTFDMIFSGPPPNFDSSKKLERTKLESLHTFFMKNGNHKEANTNRKNNLLEQMRKREEEHKVKQQEKKKMQNIIAGHLKEWHKPKEDLELIDQKKLPVPSPVKSTIADVHFGEVLMVVDFATTFANVLHVRKFFPNGFSLEIAEKAFNETEVSGYFCDLIVMLLSAIFNAQEEEGKQYSTRIKSWAAQVRQGDSDDKMLSHHQATRLATLASQWPKRHQGLPLTELSLCPVTNSEILRLHLLSSGAMINEVGGKWRYQERGGYSAEDDPGIHFRLNEPQILKALAVKNVVELPMGDKLKIVSCLIDQLLTYADIRDVIDEHMDKVKQAKSELLAAQKAENARAREFAQAMHKLKLGMKTNPTFDNDILKLEKQAEYQKGKRKYNIAEKLKESYDKQIHLGQDRAFRRFLRLDSVPGLFVQVEQDYPGECLTAPIKQYPSLIDADKKTTLAHLSKTFEEVNTSDKENSSPKSVSKLNGASLTILQQERNESRDLLMCTADSANCIVHSKENDQVRWSFYHKTTDLQDLINSLNKRGERESELRQNLVNLRGELLDIIENTPVHQLNSDLEMTKKEERSLARSRNNNRSKYVNLGFPPEMPAKDALHNALVTQILDMEEKLRAGDLGKLLVDDRRQWRTVLESRNYKEFDKTVLKREKSGKKGSENEDDEDSDEAIVDTRPYFDPGRYLDSAVKAEIDFDGENSEYEVAITCLRAALGQLGQAVEPIYLKKPLGNADVSKKSRLKVSDRLDSWERSLLASTSFSQIFLHYMTLDSCISWGKSITRTKCRICSKQNDPENMLLCDECNSGHHLYCLRPPLRSVPTGDWFCMKCAKDKILKGSSTEEKLPPRPRPIFRDEEIEEDEESEEEESASDVNEEEEQDDEETVDEEQEGVDLCKTCGTEGEMVSCEQCSACYHPECADPPMRRTPRGPWSCSQCKKRRNVAKRYCNGIAVIQRTGVINGQRRCAAKALFKIHDFAKNLRHMSDSDDDSDDDEVISRRPSRRDDVRNDLPLHNAALHELLSEIMKDSNAWPFLRPVQKNEVPDYYQVITKPMDFGTIKYKLNMGEYQADAQLMTDALLIFQNCNTYNHTDDDVYKCGVQLLKIFQKKSRDLGLKLPEEMDYNDGASKSKKKKYTK